MTQNQRKFARIADSCGELFTVEYNDNTRCYHYNADESYCGYTEDEILKSGGYIIK